MILSQQTEKKATPNFAQVTFEGSRLGGGEGEGLLPVVSKRVVVKVIRVRLCRLKLNHMMWCWKRCIAA